MWQYNVRLIGNSAEIMDNWVNNRRSAVLIMRSYQRQMRRMAYVCKRWTQK